MPRLPLLLLLGLCGASRGAEDKAYVTRYACESETLALKCPEGQVLNIKLANFGRFSISICNDAGRHDLNLQCMFRDSINIVQGRCGGQESCSVSASTGEFSDACPGTPKYLQVQYLCEDRPEAPATLPPPVVEAVSTPAKQEPPTTTAPPPPPRTPEPSKVAPVEPSTPSEPIFCPPTKRRGIIWPQTAAGYPARGRCPGNHRHYALWHCDGEGRWSPQHPDLSRCAMPWAEKLLEESTVITDAEGALRLSKKILNRSSGGELRGGDARALAQALQASATVAKASLGHLPSSEAQAKASELSGLLLSSTSRLLGPSKAAAWTDLPPAESKRAGAELLLAVERSGAMVVAAREDGAPPYVRNEPRLAMEVVRLDSVREYNRFPTSASVRSQGSVELPAEVFVSSEPLAPRVIFTSISALGSHMRPSDRLDGAKLTRRTVASDIVSASVAGRSEVTRLPRPVRITLPLTPRANGSNPVCVWWRGPPSGGEWSEEGCERTGEGNGTHEVCACDHLTSFAILMDLDGDDYAGVHHVLLSFVTYAGCVLSMVCLGVCVLAFGLMYVAGAGNEDRLLIHINLCLCLLLAETLFVFGVPQTGLGLGCSVIAGLLHYAFLAAFAWMLLEGFQLYAMLVEVFEPDTSRKPYFFLFGYGVPALIVGVSAGVTQGRHYGTQHFCWLDTKDNFLLSFVVPLGAMVAVNAVLLLMAMAIMCRHSAQSAAHRHCQRKSNPLPRLGSWLRGAFVLVVLLGLTWSLGLLLIVLPSRPLEYAFTALNSLQGLFIFLFHVLWNDKVRKEYQGFLRRASWLPDCVRSSALDTSGGLYSPATSPKGPRSGKALLSSSGGSPNRTASSPLPNSVDGSFSQPYLTKYLSGRMVGDGTAERACGDSEGSGQALLTHQAFFDPLHRYLDDGYAYAQDLSRSSHSSHSETSHAQHFDPAQQAHLDPGQHIYAEPEAFAPPAPPSFPPPLPPYYDCRSTAPVSLASSLPRGGGTSGVDRGTGGGPPCEPPVYESGPVSLAASLPRGSAYQPLPQAAVYGAYAPVYQPGVPTHKLLLVGQPSLDAAFDDPPSDANFRLPASASTLPREALHIRPRQPGPEAAGDSAYSEGRHSGSSSVSSGERRLSSQSPESGLDFSAASGGQLPQASYEMPRGSPQLSPQAVLERPELPLAGKCRKPALRHRKN